MRAPIHRLFSVRFKTIKTVTTVLLSCFVLQGCGLRGADSESRHVLPLSDGAEAIRPLATSEAVADLQELAGYLEHLYGPYQYKEKRFGYKIADLITHAESEILAAKSDDQVYGAFAELLASLHDGHVSIKFPVSSSGVSNYKIPVFVYPVADTVLVGSVEDSLKDSGIKVGDELVAIDGQAPMDLLPLVSKYNSLATPESQRHLITRILNRPAYMVDLKPKRSTASLEFKHADGTTLVQEIPWQLERTFPETTKILPNEKFLDFTYPGIEEVNREAGGSLLEFGKSRPFFVTPTAQTKFGFRQVTADDEHRTKYGLKETEKPDIYAALYRFQGKTILLVRSYTYSHQDLSNEIYMKAYKAILDQWESLADILVLDQTHNGGGSYCQDFYRLFINGNADGVVEKFHADRTWYLNLQTWAEQFEKSKQPTEALYLRWLSTMIEKAYDRGEALTPLLPLFGNQRFIGPLDYHWKKPMIVLADELAGSCADIFPMLIKHNHTAKIFGQRTMGLGGNVEVWGTLTNSRATIRGTRGLFTTYKADGGYQDSDWVENNGIEPDFVYAHSVSDTRAGYVHYIETFSQYALDQMPKTGAPIR